MLISKITKQQIRISRTFLPLTRAFSTVGSSPNLHRPVSMPNSSATRAISPPLGVIHSNCNNKRLLGLRISACGGGGSPDFRKARALPPLRQASSVGTSDRRLLNGTPLGKGGLPNYSVGDKFVVAVDVDEVLGNFVSALNRFIADRYATNHSVSEYHVYEFFKIWNCSRDEGIHPIPGAQKALYKLSRLCKLSVVTSRQNVIKDHTIEWIKNHYPGVFQEIHFGNHFALVGESRPKSEICKSLGAKVLIDDNPKYAMECAEVGIRVLLFDYENSYPWCKIDSVDHHPLVIKVYNWEQVEQQLTSLIVSQSSRI